MYINARDELFDLINGLPPILCAHVSLQPEEGEAINSKLPLNYTQDELITFFNSLNTKYDAGYGSQMLDGTIWFDGGTWASRGEYDGSEWWEYNQTPTIPDFLRTK